MSMSSADGSYFQRWFKHFRYLWPSLPLAEVRQPVVEGPVWRGRCSSNTKTSWAASSSPAAIARLCPALTTRACSSGTSRREMSNISWSDTRVTWPQSASRPTEASLSRVRASWLIGWKINVPFQHKNRLYQWQGHGWRFSSAGLRMANDTITSRPRCLLFSDDSKWESTGEAEAHVSY